MPVTIKTALPEEWSSALHLFYQNEEIAERELLVQEMFEAHQNKRISLEHLLIAQQDETIVGVMLAQQQPDSSAFFWVPVVQERADAAAIANKLLQDACQRMKQKSISFAQIILTPEEIPQTELILNNGFEQLADICYLQRSFDLPLPTQSKKFSVVPFNEKVHRKRFAKLLESTYEGTLDCPAFTSVRNGEAALLSHQHSGLYTPEHWLLFEVEGEDVGLLLMNDHPDQSAWEIVYMGVSPMFRGRGYGKMILLEGLQNVATSGREFVLLAVDKENHFASAIYEEMGFFSIANRSVFLRHF